MNDPNTDHVENFIGSIAPRSHAYSKCGLSYLAVADGTGWTLLHGRFFLAVRPLKVSLEHFRTKRVAAGHMPIPASDDGHAEFIRTMFRTGLIDTPVGKVALRSEAGGGFSAFHTPLHQVGLSDQNRLAVLLIGGGSRLGLLDQPSIDWELRAAAEPYEALNELQNALSPIGIKEPGMIGVMEPVLGS